MTTFDIDYAPPVFDMDAIPDDEWETLASAGREVMQHMDTGRWLAGDLANRCAVRYGETSLTKYAADIGISRAGTLREYARVSKFYDHATRCLLYTFSEPTRPY